MDIHKNKYGDVIIESNDETLIKKYLDLHYDPLIKTIIKSNASLPDFYDVAFESSNPDNPNEFLYINNSAREKVHRVINNRIDGAMVVLIVNYNGKIFFVFSDDYHKPWMTCPAGSIAINESFEECAVREVMEETTLDICIGNLIPFGHYDLELEVYEWKFPNRTEMYYTTKHINDEEYRTLLNHSDEEIRGVKLYSPADIREIFMDYIINCKNDIPIFRLHAIFCAILCVRLGYFDLDYDCVSFLDQSVCLSFA